jgi:hypothetical protein
MSTWKEARYSDYVLRVITSDRLNGTSYEILLLGLHRAQGISRSQDGVRLMVHYSKDTVIKIDDLQGSGHFSGFKGKGIGTLLTNVLITILQESINGSIVVTGDLTHVGDPEEPTLKVMTTRRAGGLRKAPKRG